MLTWKSQRIKKKLTYEEYNRALETLELGPEQLKALNVVTEKLCQAYGSVTGQSIIHEIIISLSETMAAHPNANQDEIFASTAASALCIANMSRKDGLDNPATILAIINSAHGQARHRLTSERRREFYIVKPNQP